jgi:hypothetical protein
MDRKHLQDTDKGLRPNGLAFSCRERTARDHVQKATISRAKRSAAMPGWAVALISFRYLFGRALLLLREKISGFSEAHRCLSG